MIEMIWQALALVEVTICEAPSFLIRDIHDYEYDAICGQKESLI